MMCNALNFNSEYFWLFISAGGIGFTAGSMLRAGGWFSRQFHRLRGGDGPRRKGRFPFIQVSLSLTVSVSAVFASLFFIRLSLIGWSVHHLYFFLTVIAASLLLRLFFSILIAPCIIVLVLYIIMAAGIDETWTGGAQDILLAEIKVLSLNDRAVSLEIHPEIRKEPEKSLFYTIDGEDAVYHLRVVEFLPWIFYPGCRHYVLLSEVTSSDYPPQAPPRFSLLEKGALMTGLIHHQEHTILQPDPELLQVYGIIFHSLTGEFEIVPR